MLSDDASNDSVSRLQALDDEELLALWRSVRVGDIDPADWLAGSPLACVLLEALARSGAEVVWPYRAPRSGDSSDRIDGLVYCSGLPPCLIHAPETRGNVGEEALLRLRKQIALRPAGTMGVCFSRSGFTAQATALAQALLPEGALVLLWSGDEVDPAVEQGRMQDRLREKYRFAVEFARADGPDGPPRIGDADV
jgi:hypothetical protein